jgi:hypothetical protein
MLVFPNRNQKMQESRAQARIANADERTTWLLVSVENGISARQITVAPARNERLKSPDKKRFKESSEFEREEDRSTRPCD